MYLRNWFMNEINFMRLCKVVFYILNIYKIVILIICCIVYRFKENVRIFFWFVKNFFELIYFLGLNLWGFGNILVLWVNEDR